MNYRARIEEVMSLRCPSSRDKRGRGLPWEYLAHRVTPEAAQYAYHVPPGYSTQDLRQETDAIYATVGRYVEIKDRGGVVVISIGLKDMPNKIPYSPDMLELAKGRQALIGYDALGKPLIHDFRVPHLLIGAMSGYGKTDLLRFIILQLITHLTPEQLWIDIIDGKAFSFLTFKNIPHIRRIVRDLASAHIIMQEARQLMEKRADQVWNANDRGLTEHFQWRLVIVDELAMISPAIVVGKDNRNIATMTYADMAAISCVGREASVGLIMATQRPDREVIHPQVKANCDVSIALHTKNQINSEIIIDHPGAEKLPCPGRAIYSSTSDTMIQIPYAGKDDVWTELLKPHYREEPINEPSEVIEDLSSYEL